MNTIDNEPSAGGAAPTHAFPVAQPGMLDGEPVAYVTLRHPHSGATVRVIFAAADWEALCREFPMGFRMRLDCCHPRYAYVRTELLLPDGRHLTADVARILVTLRKLEEERIGGDPAQAKGWRVT